MLYSTYCGESLNSSIIENANESLVLNNSANKIFVALFHFFSFLCKLNIEKMCAMCPYAQRYLPRQRAEPFGKYVNMRIER